MIYVKNFYDLQFQIKRIINFANDNNKKINFDSYIDHIHYPPSSSVRHNSSVRPDIAIFSTL